MDLHYRSPQQQPPVHGEEPRYFMPLSGSRHVYASDLSDLLAMHDLPDHAKLLSRFCILFFLTIVCLGVTVPWRQTSKGEGRVIAYLPRERVQNVHATVAGRIKEVMVREGSVVERGDPILELVDIDPRFMERLAVEREALAKQHEAAVAIAHTAKFNRDRQNDLYAKGYSARLDMEQATIAYKSAQAAEAQALANLTQIDSRIARQKSQIITAPADGTILRLMVGASAVTVDLGQVVAVFVPSDVDLAVELLIPGMDLPLVNEDRKVRLQFDGWPAIQFAGWPSVAVGTFGGKVAVVDRSANSEGLFRVIVVPDGDLAWPEAQFIRQGTRVIGWILLNEVGIGYEAWRQFNGFPPSFDRAPRATALGEPDSTPL